MESAIQKIEKIPIADKTQILEKITELTIDKNNLEEIYIAYQLKLKELSNILDEYERMQHASRIHLRKIQLWLKFTYTQLVKSWV